MSELYVMLFQKNDFSQMMSNIQIELFLSETLNHPIL